RCVAGTCRSPWGGLYGCTLILHTWNTISISNYDTRLPSCRADSAPRAASRRGRGHLWAGHAGRVTASRLPHWAGHAVPPAAPAGRTRLSEGARGTQRQDDAALLPRHTERPRGS